MIDAMVWRLSAAHPDMRPAWLQARLLPVPVHNGNKKKNVEKSTKGSPPPVRLTTVSADHQGRPMLVPRYPTMGSIADHVMHYYGMTKVELVAKRREKHIIRARFTAMLLARELTPRSFPVIAKYFGCEDHSTVVHATRKARKWIETKPDYAAEYYAIKNSLMQGLKQMEADG